MFDNGSRELSIRSNIVPGRTPAISRARTGNAFRDKPGQIVQNGLLLRQDHVVVLVFVDPDLDVVPRPPKNIGGSLHEIAGDSDRKSDFPCALIMVTRNG